MSPCSTRSSEARAFYVIDGGCIDFERLHVFALSAAFSVTRTKKNFNAADVVDMTTGEVMIDANQELIPTVIGKRIVLIHELRQLAGAENVLPRRGGTHFRYRC
jgi:hypothetical protein